MKYYFEENKRGWNKRVKIHFNSAFYDVENFRKGASSLKFIELEALGNVKGKSLLHLQCHFGLDSLSLARMGANVTGIDFSEQGIAAAEKLKKEFNLDVRFLCCNLYEMEAFLNEEFDIIFTSYGVLTWLNDLNEWGRLIAKFIKPGGFFFIVEFHPFLGLFDEKFERLEYSYFNQNVPELFTSQGTYAQPDSELVFKDYQWNHSLQDIFQAVLSNGLIIKDYCEYPYSVYNCFPGLVRGNDGWWRIKGLEGKIPLMFSLKAVK